MPSLVRIRRSDGPNLVDLFPTNPIHPTLTLTAHELEPENESFKKAMEKVLALIGASGKILRLAIQNSTRSKRLIF